MNKESFEHLSSLMDGELSRETGRFMARRLTSDNELRGAWQRYHMIRDCLRQPGERSVFLDLSERMRSELDSRAEAAPAPAARRWLRPVAGLAVAASVAVMAVTLVGPDLRPGAPSATPVQPQPFSSPNTLPAVPLSQPASYSPDDRAAEQRLNSYLLRHSQLATSAGSQGFVSLVPIISSRAAADQADRQADKGDNEEAPSRNVESNAQ